MKHISYSHQHEYFPVSFYELYEQFGMERSEYLTNHRYRTFEFGVTEEYPAETYEMEGNDDSKNTSPAGTAVVLGAMEQTADKFMHGQSYTVKCSPDNEIP